MNRRLFVMICKYANLVEANGDFIDPQSGLIFQFENNGVIINGVIDINLYQSIIKRIPQIFVKNDKTLVEFDDNKKYIELLILDSALNISVELLDLIGIVSAFCNNKKLKNELHYTKVKKW